MFMRELANELNYTIRTIQRHAKELERYGLLKRQYRKKSWNRNDKNIFILTGEIDFETLQVKKISTGEILDGVKGLLDEASGKPQVRQIVTHNVRQNVADTSSSSITLIGNSGGEENLENNPEVDSKTGELKENLQTKVSDSPCETDDLSEVDPLTLVKHSDEIPEAMRDAVRYYFEKTGNNPRWFNGKAVGAVKAIAKLHTPERVKSEIDRAVNRFIEQHRSLYTLYFGYIAAALSGQYSTLPRKKKRLDYGGSDGNMTAEAVAVTLDSSTGPRMSREEMLEILRKFKEIEKNDQGSTSVSAPAFPGFRAN